MTPLFLVGYRGTGKSTVARQLAERWGWPHDDSDDLIEARTGRTIGEIFAEEGEGVFRELERQVVAELCRKDRRVVSLGGGAILDPGSRRAIARAGRVVWLTAPPEVIAARLAQDENSGSRRPALTAKGLLGEITEVLALRTPLYRECASWEVSTVGKSPGEIAGEIAAWWASQEGPPQA